jgi:hypothetical protein
MLCLLLLLSPIIAIVLVFGLLYLIETNPERYERKLAEKRRKEAEEHHFKHFYKHRNYFCLNCRCVVKKEELTEAERWAMFKADRDEKKKPEIYVAISTDECPNCRK